MTSIRMEAAEGGMQEIRLQDDNPVLSTSTSMFVVHHRNDYLVP